jgi:hypothetical protein
MTVMRRLPIGNKIVLLLILVIGSLTGSNSSRAEVDTNQINNATATTDKTEVKDAPFEIKLMIENGHIGHVFVGCHNQATDDFDNRLDDMAPPPGMGGVGYTFLVSPDRKYNLYKDIRGFSDIVTWIFYAKPGTKPTIVSWDPGSIPKGWDMFCSPWDGKSKTVESKINGKTTTSVKTDKTGFFRFWMQRKTTSK